MVNRAHVLFAALAVTLAASLLSRGEALATPSQQALIEMADLSGPAISPDGQWAAFRQNQASLARNRQELSWWLVAVDGRTGPRRVAGGGDAIWSDYGGLRAEPPRWSPDSQAFYFRALIDDQVQVWRVLRAGSAVQVTRDAADIEAFALSADGTRLIYAVGPPREDLRRAEARQYDEGVRIDAHVDPSQSLFAAIEMNGRLAAQRLTGKWFDHGSVLWDQPRRYFSLDLATGAVRPATNEEAASAGIIPAAKAKVLATSPVSARSPDGTLLAVATGEREARRLEVRRGDTIIGLCTGGACQDRVTGLAWRGSGEVIFTTHDTSRRQILNAWRLSDDKARVVIKAEGLLDGGDGLDAPCAVDAVQAVCVAAAAAAPPRLVRIDLESGRQTVLANPNRGLTENAPTVEPLAWRDAGNRPFTGFLLRPSSPSPERPWPLFVTYYVCDGYLRGGTGDEWPLASLAQSGIAALCINKTPSTGGAYDAAADYRAAQDGIETVIGLLAKRGVIDPRKVGMGGLSFGSEVTTWMSMHSTQLAAASIASTQVEPAYYWANGVAGRDTPDMLRRVWGLGPPGETPQAWASLSPALNVERIHAPMLVQIPEQEYRMIPEFIAKLSRSTTPSEVYAFPNEPHILVQPRHRAAAYARNLDWFRYWLQGYEDPDPAKETQYIRWRAMAARRQPSP
jgi:dipeptidyl aminopeptidase/acylaminoacyl peptidase